ncbi:MAG: lamin tail domain-containing protein [Bacteroidota bacterium]
MRRSLLFLLFCCAWAIQLQAQPPINDECDNATELFLDQTVIGTITDATDSDNTDRAGEDVWFKFVGTGETVTFNTCPDEGPFNTDIRMIINTGSCASLNEEENVDDSFDLCPVGVTPVIPDFFAEEGVEYLIVCEGVSTSMGDFKITVEGPYVPVPGDIIITEIMNNPEGLGNTSDNLLEHFEVYNTTDEAIDLNGWTISDNGNDEHTIASSVIVPADGFAVLQRTNAQGSYGFGGVTYMYGTDIALANGDDEIILTAPDMTEIDRVEYDDGVMWPNSSGASMNLDPDFFNATDNDNPDNWCSSSTALPATNDLTDNRPITTNRGLFTDDKGTPNRANDDCPEPLPANDECENAITITCGETVMGSTTNATGALEQFGVGSPAVFYRFVGTGDLVTISLCGSDYNTFLDLWEGPCDNLGENIAFTGNGCGDGDEDAQLTAIPTEDGVEYIILVSSDNLESGDYTLEITCVSPPPANDECENATTITCGEEVSGSTEFATNSATGDFSAPDVWYYFEGTGDLVTFSLCGTTYGSILEIYTGDDCDNLELVISDVQACGFGLGSEITNFQTEVGTNYFILIDGDVVPDDFGNALTYQGEYVLSVTCTPPPPPNDLCENATTVTCGETVMGSTDAATTTGAPGNCSIDVTAPGVWYVLEGDDNEVTASLCDLTIFDTKITVYSGSCNELVCVADNDDFCDEQSQVTFDAMAGTTYYIYVHGFETQTGDFNLEVTCIPLCDLADPTPATATKTFCASADLMPSLANTGINVSNTLAVDEKVVWKLTDKPDGSAYSIGDEFTTDDCGDPFKNFGELAVANSSKVIRVQDVANAPEGTYTFDVFIEDCTTACTSELVSGFSITVNAQPAVPTVNRLTRDACVGGTATVSVVDPGAGFDVFWTVVAAPDDAIIAAGNAIGPGEETGEYRTNLEANGIRFRIKGNMMVVPGLYQLQASVVNTTTDCKSELTTEVFEINIFEQPTVEITSDLPIAIGRDICLGTTGIQYNAIITSTDGGTYTYDWCAYNSGDGSGSCFGGFSDNTIQMPTRNWTSSAGPKSVGVTVASNVTACTAEALYSFNVEPAPMVACPADQTVTLATNPETFDCETPVMFTNPMVGTEACGPYTLTISIDGGEAEEVVAGEEYTLIVDALGVVEVSYTLTDGLGRETTCSFEVTVDGLPCGLADNGGVGCDGSTTTFDQDTETFSLTSDCAPNTMLYTEDGTAFVFTELCGDGEITAKVTGLNGTGFAGLMLRETEAPNAKKMALGTNNVDRLRKEVRVIDGYPSSAAEIISFNQFWIRVVRSGTTFSAFASTDGIFWQPYLSQTIVMGDCILAGLYTYSEKPGNAVTATFTDVSVTGLDNLGENLGAPIAIGVQGLSLAAGLRIYPNPAVSEITIDLANFQGQAADIRIVNQLGQLMERVQIEDVQVNQVLDVSKWSTGIYNVVVKVGKDVVTERFVIARP